MSVRRRDVVLNVRQWIERAEEDLRLANHAMTMKTAVPYRLVAYHAQQCAEKCLKAYLVAGMTDFPYTHNVGALLELCAPTAAWVPDLQGAEALSTYESPRATREDPIAFQSAKPLSRSNTQREFSRLYPAT